MYSLGNAYGLRPCALTPHIHLAPDYSYAQVTWTHDRPPYNGSKVYVWVRTPQKQHARVVARQFTAPEWAAEQTRLISERKLSSQDSYRHSLGGTYPYGLTHSAALVQLELSHAHAPRNYIPDLSLKPLKVTQPTTAILSVSSTDSGREKQIVLPLPIPTTASSSLAIECFFGAFRQCRGPPGQPHQDKISKVSRVRVCLSTLQFDARTRSLAVDSAFDTPESPPVA
ncbi:hypothetical protein C8R48DRAFT_674212 [Suillus tomentosus]|nr:hypothetical protein C8R48DRAFT_674212 [Suillus tomentosus]